MNSQSPSPQPSPGVRFDNPHRRPGEGAGSATDGMGQRATEARGNIVLPLTGAGMAAVAVVRVSGALSADFLRIHFSKLARSGRCVHGEVRDEGAVIDDAVVVLSEDQQQADINLHGSSWTVARVIELAKKFGFRAVDDAGEQFLFGADGDTPLEREVTAWLPLARSELAMRMLAAQVDAWNTLRETMPEPERLKEIGADTALWRMLHPPCLAIVGRPNVGKSTLANRLFGQERSITAHLAGTTRDWVGDYANIDGLPIMLIDTPGVRETEDRIEADAIDASREQIAGADLVLWVVDAAQANFDVPQFPKAIRVFNKCDLNENNAIGAAEGLRVSAKTGAGIDGLRQAIVEFFGCGQIDVNEARWWTQRQREVLERGSIP